MGSPVTVAVTPRRDVKGQIRVYDVSPDGLPSLLFSRPNQRQVGWGTIAAQCIGAGNADYRVAGMYLEFENTASPGDPVTAPVFDEYEGVEYYQDLALSSDRDFLRIPLQLSPSISVEDGYEDYFTQDGEGNRVSFFAQSQGTAGVHGKAFTAAANSTVFGVALVAMPVPADPSRDVVLARAYFDVGQQVAKTASRQIAIGWDVSFLIT